MSDDTFEFTLPWERTGLGVGLGEEQAPEIAPGHRLEGKAVRTVARRVDTDDVLFQIDSDPPVFASVHLTWKAMRETDPAWPSARLFDSRETWRLEEMLPDATVYKVKA